MNLGYLISRRIYKKDRHERRISSPVLKIAVAAVALGIVVMLIALSTGIGLQREIRRNIAAFAGHIQLTAPQQGGDGTTQSVSLNQDFYPYFTAVPQVKHVQTFAQRAGILKTDHEFEGVVLKGLGADYDLSGLSAFVKSGKMPRFGQGEASDSLLISQNTADALGLSCGERVKMYFIRDSGRPILRYFTIAGIFKSNIAEFDKNYALGDLRAVQSINRWDSTQVGGFELILHNAKELPAATERVLAETQWKFHVTNIATEYGALLDWVAMFDVNIVVILGIMILVCGVNMITVLLILILEKTSFIGMMKSLGADQRLLRQIFLWNAFYIILRGLFWGNLIGISLLLLQKYFGIVTLDSESYSIEVVPVYLSLGMILALNLGTALLNMLMLLIPSHFIARIRPAETAKYE